MSEREPEVLADPPADDAAAPERPTRMADTVVDFEAESRAKQAEVAEAIESELDGAPDADAEPAPVAPPRAVARETDDRPVVKRREGELVHVVGFWRRAAAAIVDLAVIIPATLIITFLASKISGVHMPPSNLHLLDIDLWIDLVLATDPAIVMGLVLFVAIGLAYLLVFQILLGRTLGMRLLRIKIIDVYGDKPSPAICLVRCAGYIASAATLFLGFLWVGFDSEKRGLQDWIAGTYVIRA